jgi:hypothetical protein
MINFYQYRKGQTCEHFKQKNSEAIKAAMRLEDKALLCIRIAVRMLSGASEVDIEDTAADLMSLSWPVLTQINHRQETLAQTLIEQETLAQTLIEQETLAQTLIESDDLDRSEIGKILVEPSGTVSRPLTNRYKLLR